jgi:hypothetical protein
MHDDLPPPVEGEGQGERDGPWVAVAAVELRRDPAGREVHHDAVAAVVLDDGGAATARGYVEPTSDRPRRRLLPVGFGAK